MPAALVEASKAEMCIKVLACIRETDTRQTDKQTDMQTSV